MTTPWIQTYTGRKVDLLAPLPGQFDPVDITWHLAHLCRFTGATHRFYSVAEHSVLVCQHVMQLTNDPDTHRAALLHDGTEAYLGDVSRPLKKLLPTYMGIEHAFEEIITRRFALKWHDREKIKTVEEQRAQAEARMREELKTAAEQGRRRDEEHRQSEEKLKREYADREFQYSKEANECAKRLSACEQNAAECRARIEERALRSDERPGTSGSPRDRTPPAAGVKK